MSKVGTCLSTTKTSVWGLLLAGLIGFGFSSCNQEDEPSTIVEKAQVGRQQDGLRASSYDSFNNKTYYHIWAKPKDVKMFSLAIDLSKYHSSARYTLSVDYTGGGSEVLTISSPIPANGIVKAYTTAPVKLIDIVIQSDNPISGSYGLTY